MRKSVCGKKCLRSAGLHLLRLQQEAATSVRGLRARVVRFSQSSA